MTMSTSALLSSLLCFVCFVTAVYFCLLSWRNLFSPVLLISVVFPFLYVVSHIFMSDEVKGSFLLESSYQRLISLATAAFLAYAFGYFTLPSRREPRSIRLPSTSPLIVAVLFWISFAGWLLFLQRSGGFFTFYSSVHGAAGAWESSSAYLYYQEYFIIIWTGFLWWIFLHGGYLTTFCKVTMFVGAAGMLAHVWFTGDRGNAIYFALFFFLPIIIWQARRPFLNTSMLVWVYGPILAGCIVLFPHIRHATPWGSELSLHEALKSIERSPLEGSGAFGSEVYVAAAVIEAARQQRVYDFGRGWLRPIVNFVPRAVWPEKPGWFGSVDTLELARATLGVPIAIGAAPTGLADAFVRFGWLAPIAFFFFGCWGRRVWDRAWTDRDFTSLLFLLAYMNGFKHFLLQGFNLAFYYWLFPVAAFYVLLAIASRVGVFRGPAAFGVGNTPGGRPAGVR